MRARAAGAAPQAAPSANSSGRAAPRDRRTQSASYRLAVGYFRAARADERRADGGAPRNRRSARDIAEICSRDVAPSRCTRNFKLAGVPRRDIFAEAAPAPRRSIRRSCCLRREASQRTPVQTPPPPRHPPPNSPKNSPRGAAVASPPSPIAPATCHRLRRRCRRRHRCLRQHRRQNQTLRRISALYLDTHLGDISRHISRRFTHDISAPVMTVSSTSEVSRFSTRNISAT